MLVRDVRRSSEVEWDVYVCLFQQVEAQSVKWLENLQTRGVVSQRCRDPLQQLNLWNLAQLVHGCLVVSFQVFVM